jgi:hypothetical protein
VASAGQRYDITRKALLTHRVLVALLIVALIALEARAEEKEPQAIVEIGGSGNWSFSGASSFGPTAAVEFTPIKDWLEIEVGTGPMFGKGISEWDTDILFKKPFTLSEKVEFMIGAGPQWGSAFSGSTKAGVEIAGDFMFLAVTGSKARMVL